MRLVSVARCAVATLISSTTVFIAAASDSPSTAEILRDQGRLRQLTLLCQKTGPSGALISNLKRLADAGVTPGIRREAAFLAGTQYVKLARYPGDQAAKQAEEVLQAIAASPEDVWGMKAALALGDLRRENGDAAGAINANEMVRLSNVVETETVLAALGVAAVSEERKAFDMAYKAAVHGLKVAERLYEHDRDSVKAAVDSLRRIKGRIDTAREIARIGEAAMLVRQGNTALGLKQYARALELFGRVLSQYPESESSHEATVGAAQCRYWLSQFDEACGLLTPFVHRLPAGPFRAQARILLGDIALLHELNATVALEQYSAAAAYCEGRHESRQAARWCAEERLGI